MFVFFFFLRFVCFRHHLRTSLGNPHFESAVARRASWIEMWAEGDLCNHVISCWSIERTQ